jgi:ferric-dicitrate binding protein FerR (iron transport regulator)
MNEPKPTNECETIAGLLFELRDGSLDAATEAAVRAHLTRCAACRAAFDFDSRLANRLRADNAPSPSDLATRVRGRLRRQRRIAAIAYATAAAVLVAGVLGIWRPWARSEVAIVESNRPAPTPPAGDIDVAALFEPPPVDSLDVLNRQQSGYVVALRRLGEE